MRSFGVFIAGAAVFTFALLFPMLEPAAEAVAAIAFVAAVAYGFAVHPRKDVFYIRTTTRMHDLDGNLMIDHDQLAVRIETARLWLLFIPTALSVGFLGVTSAKETLWRFSLVESFVHSQEAVEIAWGVFRIPVYLAGLGLWIWVTERRVLRDADACSARSYQVSSGRVGFQFVTDKGKYGGGEDFYVGLAKPREVATLVFYDVDEIDRCKIGMSLLFHKILVLGRGLTEIDQETAAAHGVIRGVATS
ncbi:MAG TPA: hypothetical protein VFU57_07890 [Candidatus Acidoferrales bacterium]|nr:hypothetical protein [Candidatus Acidoferrales bacterium]